MSVPIFFLCISEVITMLEVIPVYINSPFDQSNEVDLDEEYTEDINHPDSETAEESNNTEGIPDDNEPLTGDDVKDITGVDDIVPDPPENDIPNNIEEAIDGHKDITNTNAHDLKDLDESVQSSILDDIQEASSTATESWTDLEGTVSEKLDNVNIKDIAHLKNAMESILGVICGNGVANPDLDIPVYDNIFKDLINKGLKDLLDCLMKEGIISGLADHAESIVIDSINSVIKTGSPDMLTWTDETVTGGLGNYYKEELIPPISESIKLPLNHKKADNKSLLDSVTRVYSSLKPDWLYSPFRAESSSSSYRSLDAFTNPSEGMKTLYESDYNYTVSVIAGEAIKENGEKTIKDTHSLSYL